MKSEKELLHLLKTGDENSVKIIFDSFYEELCLYAEEIIKDHQTAEEIVEDLFIYIWINSKQINIYSSVKNYLFRSIHNNCLKYLDKRKREKNKIDIFNYLTEDKEILNQASVNFPLSNLIAKELEEKATQILESLPSECRKIYELNRFENLNYPEIAEKLNISLSTVKTQMSRAFKKFRETLKDYMSIFFLTI